MKRKREIAQKRERKKERVSGISAAEYGSFQKALTGMGAMIMLMAMMAVLAGCGTGESNDVAQQDAGIYAGLESIELIGADSTAQGSAGQLWGQYVAERVSEITSGKLTIDYHPNGDLGGDADLMRQTIDGDIDLVVCQTAPMVSFVPEMAAFDLPMVFSGYDGDTIDSVLNGENGFTAAMSSAYEAKGLHPLGFLQNATYRLTTANVPLYTLEDFKSLQIRTMENANHMAFWQAIGAEPTPLAWAEVYISLKNGTIDAQENAADTCTGANFQEVQKYLACTNHILYCNQMCINKTTFDGLDPLYQEALEQAVSEANEYIRPQLKEMDESSKQILEDGGMTIITYEDEFFDEIRELKQVKTLYEEIDSSIGGLGTLLTDALANGSGEED